MIFKYLFFCLFVYPLVFILVGVNLKNRQRIRKIKGPAIVIANHNSHLDTLVLMSLFPLESLKKVRPVAAAFYWQKNFALSLFSKYFMDVIPIKQNKEDFKTSFHKELKKTLEAGGIAIYFPEGTRGEAEVMGKFKTGIYYLAQEFQDIPVFPVFLYGMGQALPRGEALLVPFVCHGNIGEGVIFKEFLKEKNEKEEEKEAYLHRIQKSLLDLREELHFKPWQ